MMDVLNNSIPISIRGASKLNGVRVRWSRGGDLILNGGSVLIRPSFQDVISFLAYTSIELKHGTVVFRDTDTSTTYSRELLPFCIEWERRRKVVLEHG